MGCLNEQAVQAVVDGEASDQIRQHAASCDRCAHRVAERRRDIATLMALGESGDRVPSQLDARVRRALASPHVAGATALRPASAGPRWRLAPLGAALATAAAVAIVVFAILPRFGAPTSLSAAEVLNRSLQTLTTAHGVERLEYELIVSGIADGTHRIEHLIDHDRPARYRLSTVGPDGSVQFAVAQDPVTGRRSQLARVDGRNYIVNVPGTTTLPSMPQMAEAQLQAVITMMQATSDQKLSIVHAADGLQYVVEIPPVIPSGGAAALDIYQARTVIDGTDFRIREFQANGALLKQPFTVSFRLIRRELSESVPPEAFSIEPAPGDEVLEGEPSDEPWVDVLGAALREIARLKANR